MSLPAPLMHGTAIICVVAPGLCFGVLALADWLSVPLRERTVVGIVTAAQGAATIAALSLVIMVFLRGTVPLYVPLGDWFALGHHTFPLVLVVDRLSAPFAALAAVLVGVVSAFSARYLHRERGFARFYFLLSLFGAAVQLVVLAGSLDLVFFGWELVGLTSALLIAFFDERPLPVRHGLRAFITYRACDAGLLAAIVIFHHTVGSTSFVRQSAEAWLGLPVPVSSVATTLVGLLLCWAAMGKSAQVPLGGWLPRAMEGPTPSSAIFYGALSIHLGAYLLLRAAPILDRAPLAAAAVVGVGALTTLHGTFVGRAQTDIKSALAYASMTQVGMIFMELGLGLRLLPVIHIAGHASLRTLQLLRAPSLLYDVEHLEQAMGSHLPRTGGHLERWVPKRLQPWLYRLALERGYLDSIVCDYVVGGFVRCFGAIDHAEERWMRFLERERSTRTDPNGVVP